MSNLNEKLISFSNSPSVDAFGRVRVSSPETLFDSKQLFSKQPLLWTEKVTGAGSSSIHNIDHAATIMTVGSSIGDKVTRQSRQYLNYQPGKSHEFLGTTVLGSQTDGIAKRLGYFDDRNGVFFENLGSTLSVVIRSTVTGSIVDTKTPQSSWNKDKMDGTGPSGIVLDITKAQIFFIDLEWLGVGTVRWGVVIDGIIYYVHYSNHANNIVSVYMSTPNLPIRYEIENVSGTSSCNMKHICSMITSEGGFNPAGLLWTANNIAGIQLSDDNIHPLVSIRKKTDTKFRGNFIKIARLNIMSSSTANLFWGLYINPTITGGAAASWTSVHDESGMEYDIARTGTVSGGALITSGFVSDNQDTIDVVFNSKIGLGYDLDYTPDQFVLAVRRLSNLETVFGSINWEEFA